MLKWASCRASNSINASLCVWNSSRALPMAVSESEVCQWRDARYMKSSKALTTCTTRPSVFEAIKPRKTCSISLCSYPVHCVTLEMPFLKWWSPVSPGIVLKHSSRTSSLTRVVHHLTRGSLNTPLWSWCRRSGVNMQNISLCSKFTQNGLCTGHMPNDLNSSSSPALRVPHSCAFSKHRVSSLDLGSHGWWDPHNVGGIWLIGHRFSMQHATRHCSG